eukprot:4334225-Pyramimonas_sp.AAC.1
MLLASDCHAATVAWCSGADVPRNDWHLSNRSLAADGCVERSSCCPMGPSELCVFAASRFSHVPAAPPVV